MPSSAEADSLPAMLYMLSIDVDKERVPDRKKIGYVVRAAALIELRLRGNITDVGGKVHVTSEKVTGDPVLDQVLREIAADGDRKWKHWIRHNDGDTLNALQSQLVGAGAITVRERRFLGDKVDAADPAAIGQLRQRLSTTLTGAQQIETLNPHDVALTALAAIGELSAAIPDKERRANKARVRALTAHIGRSAPALKNLLAELRWLNSTGGWIASANARSDSPAP